MNTRTSLLIVTLTVCIASGGHCAEDALAWSFAGKVRYDDNIGFAPDSDSRRDTFSTRVSGTLDWLPVNGARSTMNVGLTPFYEGVSSLEDLSNYGATLALGLRHQFNESFLAPWISADVEATLIEFEDSDLRNGYLYEAEIAIGKNFSEVFGATIGYRYQKRVSTDDNPEGTLPGGDSDEVFDQDRDGPFIKLDVSPSPRTTIFGEYMYLDGDVAATGAPGNFLNGAQFPRARDFAFEEGANFIVWKIPATQDVYSLGLTQALSDKLTLEFTGNYLDASSDSGNDYDNWVVTAEIVFSL